MAVKTRAQLEAQFTDQPYGSGGRKQYRPVDNGDLRDLIDSVPLITEVSGGEQTIRLLGPYEVNFDDAGIEATVGVAFGPVLPEGAILFKAWVVTHELWDAGDLAFMGIGLGTGQPGENIFLAHFNLQSDEYAEADKVVANVPEEVDGAVTTVVAQNTELATIRARVVRTGDAPTQGRGTFSALIAAPA